MDHLLLLFDASCQGLITFLTLDFTVGVITLCIFASIVVLIRKMFRGF